MKVYAFNGSPHPKGGVYTGIKIVADELAKESIDTEIVDVGLKAIRGCNACYKCRELKKCVFNDDPVNEYIEKMKDADGIIIGSPVYYSGIAGAMKCFLDRLFFAGSGFKYKVGAAVVSVRRAGGVSTFQQIHNYFNLAQIIITPSRYWNVIHGRNEEEVDQDKEGVQTLRTVGRNMAWLIKTIAAGKKDIPEPVELERIATNFIR